MTTEPGAAVGGRRPPIRFGALLSSQGTDWSGLLEAAREVELAGFDSIWTSDHLISSLGSADRWNFDGWSVISAIGAQTSGPTVGLMVSANTFRHPALVAKMAVTLDHVTGGRAILGMGAGWFELEHTMHGLPFDSSAGKRIDDLDQALGRIAGWLGDSPRAGTGSVEPSPIVHAPGPVQRHLPILVGGQGRHRTLAVVARWADMWGARGALDELVKADDWLRDHCTRLGRDEATIERLVNRWIVVRDSRHEALEAIDTIMREQGILDRDALLVAGRPDEVAAELQSLIEAGFAHIVWTFRAPWDLESIRRAAEVRALLAA